MTPRETFVSVDVEASGPIPGTYSLLAIGACVVDSRLDRTFYAELKPLNQNADPKALSVIGRSLEEFERTGQQPADAMSRFGAWIEAEVAGTAPVFVGFNAPFDWSFVNWYFLTFDRRNPFGVSALDIKSYYMGRNRVAAWSGTRSSKICTVFGLPGTLTHHALEDARVQAEMFRRMREIE